MGSNDEQTAINQTIIQRQSLNDVTVTVTRDEQAVVIGVGDKATYYAPFEARDVADGIASTATQDGWYSETVEAWSEHVSALANVVDDSKELTRGEVSEDTQWDPSGEEVFITNE